MRFVINIKTTLKEVDFLHVRLNLWKDTYKPHRKPNDKAVYIHPSSNFSPAIIKQIPKSSYLTILAMESSSMKPQKIMNHANIVDFIFCFSIGNVPNMSDYVISCGITFYWSTEKKKSERLIPSLSHPLRRSRILHSRFSLLISHSALKFTSM